MKDIQKIPIYILLTAQPDPFSRLFRIVTAGKYSHASIGLEGYNNRFFSFVTKDGFRIEWPTMSRQAHKRAKPCALFRLDADIKTYEAVRDKITVYQTSGNRYRYSFLGLFFCLIGIPLRRENCYFCSQFVSELLTSSGAMPLHKQPSLFLPDDFRRENELKLCFQGTLGDLAELQVV